MAAYIIPVAMMVVFGMVARNAMKEITKEPKVDLSKKALGV